VAVGGAKMILLLVLSRDLRFVVGVS
jgi:hypothetical protein